MKEVIFVDTSYILALVNKADKYHILAKEVSTQIQPPFLTTEAVLIEVGNALAKPSMRLLGIQTLQRLRQDTNLEVVSVTHDLFERAIRLYQSRMDKEWGLTDCISFVVMQEHHLQMALTADHHFEQAGFVRLMQV